MTTTTIDLNRRNLLSNLTVLACLAPAVGWTGAREPAAAGPWRTLSDADWKARLPPAAYAVLRHAATEIPFTSPLNQEHRQGVFSCRGCGLALFKSSWKFDSGTGWPSFYEAIRGSLGEKADYAIGVRRTEYHCSRCLGHQGHVFDDGPAPTGLRYCNNGVALSFSAA
jgi:peptide-methionine (R)-S-oxide reductase